MTVLQITESCFLAVWERQHPTGKRFQVHQALCLEAAVHIHKTTIGAYSCYTQLISSYVTSSQQINLH